MSTTYSTLAGDTYEDVARRVYGTDANASLIRSANPGTAEPLKAGAFLIVPADPGAPARKSQRLETVSRDEVSLLIDGKRFRYFTSLSVSRRVDGFSTVSVGAPYNASDADFREAMRQFQFKSVEVFIGGSPVFSGVLVAVTPSLGSKEKKVQASGYTRAGVLADCNAPMSAYPLEFFDDDMKTVTEKLIGPFSLKATFLKEAGAKFDQGLNLSPQKKIWPFLVRLAKQRNLLIRDDDKGDLVFWVPNATPAVPDAVLDQGASPLIRVTPDLDPQQYFSHVTGREPMFLNLDGASYTVINALLKGVLRPFTFEIDDTSGATLKEATEAATGRMFASAVKYEAEVATWRKPNGKIWQPGDFVQLTAPDAMIFKPYTFVVRGVTLSREEKSSVASLELSIPESLRGELPKALPWDE